MCSFNRLKDELKKNRGPIFGDLGRPLKTVCGSLTYKFMFVFFFWKLCLESVRWEFRVRNLLQYTLPLLSSKWYRSDQSHIFPKEFDPRYHYWKIVHVLLNASLWAHSTLSRKDDIIHFIELPEICQSVAGCRDTGVVNLLGWPPDSHPFPRLKHKCRQTHRQNHLILILWNGNTPFIAPLVCIQYCLIIALLLTNIA